MKRYTIDAVYETEDDNGEWCKAEEVLSLIKKLERVVDGQRETIDLIVKHIEELKAQIKLAESERMQ